MSLPVLKVELALTTRPTEIPTWVDVTAYCEAVQIKRGRQYELDRVEVGQATVVLKNLDRRFDPTNAAGPYYGNLKPMRRVRISCVWSGTTYYLFTGYIQKWPLLWPAHGIDARVELPCVDGLKLLDTRLTMDMPSQLTSDRITSVLGRVGWTNGTCWVVGSTVNGLLGTSTVVGPNGSYDVEVGLGTMQDDSANTLEASGLIHDAEDVEQGVFFANFRGQGVFHNRHHRIDPITSNCTFGDAAGELPYSDNQPEQDTDHLWTEVTVTADDGTTATQSDLNSRLDYFPNTHEITSLPVGGTTVAIEVDALSQHLLRLHKQPGIRFAVLEPGVMRSDSIWTYALVADLGYRITVNRRPPGGGAVISLDCHVEGISWDIKPQGFWKLGWQLSPAESTSYWKLGDGSRSQLGTTTLVAY